MAGTFYTVNIYNKSGTSTLYSDGGTVFKNTNTIGDILSSSTIMSLGITAVSSSVGGASLQDDTSLETIAVSGIVTLYDVTPSAETAETITGFMHNGTEYVFEAENGGVTSVNGSTGDVTGLQTQHSTLSLTLASADWSSNTITVTASGVTSSNTVIVSPAPSSISDYADNGVRGTGQASNSLTFECDTEPENDISVNVLILN